MLPMITEVLFPGMGLSELFPLFCGSEDCRAGDSYGPAVRDHFLVHYIRSGRGVFSCASGEFSLSTGQCFLICPGEKTVYSADKKDPWHYTWLAFSGEYAARFLRAANLDAEHPVIDSTLVAQFFGGLHGRIMEGSLDGNGYEALSLLYAFFAALPHAEPAEIPRETYIGKARNYIFRMYQNPIRIAQLAAYCGLDRHYLCRIFKEETGSTLQAYVIGLKMRRARELLLSTELRVGDVARSVGYTDVYNFSKMFKKHFGFSPLRLRQEEASQQKQV